MATFCSNKESEFLKLREKLKKQIRASSSSVVGGGGDKFVSFLGPSQPSISRSRVIQGKREIMVGLESRVSNPKQRQVRSTTTTKNPLPPPPPPAVALTTTRSTATTTATTKFHHGGGGGGGCMAELILRCKMVKQSSYAAAAAAVAAKPPCDRNPKRLREEEDDGDLDRPMKQARKSGHQTEQILQDDVKIHEWPRKWKKMRPQVIELLRLRLDFDSIGVVVN